MTAKRQPMVTLAKVPSCFVKAGYVCHFQMLENHRIYWCLRELSLAKDAYLIKFAQSLQDTYLNELMKTNRIPIVAIVGRPNVGKSTLFNRIIGRQDAIVDPTPGVTRDRHYEIGDWNGRCFVLIDTGGYIPESRDLIDVAVREQAEMAMDEADLVMFVIDASSSLSHPEQMIANTLKRGGKTTLLVVNKVDNQTISQNIAADPEVFRLGLGIPLQISALNSRQIGDLLDAIIEALGDDFIHSIDDITYEEDVVKLAVIGKPNVGKSSFVNAVLGTNKLIVSDVPGTTRDSIHSDFLFDNQRFQLIDTAGLRRKAKVKENLEFYSTLRTLKSIQECDVALLLIDSLEGMAAQDINVLEEARRLKKGLVVAVNKWDLVEKDDKTYLHYERNLKRALGGTNYVPVVFMSAIKKQRTLKALEVAKAVFEERRRSVSTSSLNGFLAKAIQKNHPPAVRGKHIKINYMTQVKARPPVFALFTNEPTLLPANYRQYLENQFREEYGFEGVPISMTFRKKSKDRFE